MTRHEDPTQFYGLLGDTYDRVRPPYPENMVEWVIQQTGLQPGATVADIGAGTGLLGEAFANRKFNVVMVDPNAVMLDKAGEKAASWPVNVETTPATADQTEIADHSVDLIVVGNAAHWCAASKGAKEIPEHWKSILKEGGKAAFFYMVPSLEDPVVKAVHEALTGPDALEKYPNLAKGYQNAVFYVFSDWDKIDCYANALLDQKPVDQIPPSERRIVAPMYENGYIENRDLGWGLGYAMEEMVPVRRPGDNRHPVDAVLDYFRTITPTRPVLELDPKQPELYHPEEGERLAAQVKEDVKNAEDKPVQWACRVYLGEPHTRELTPGEKCAPTPKTADCGVFGKYQGPYQASRG